MKVGVLGGGILGLTVAYFLSKEKNEVYLFEKENGLGGLSGCFVYKGVEFEKYHHFVSLSDEYLKQLLDELGLRRELSWQETKIGYFLNGKLVPFTTPFEIINFPNLSFLDKLRFGLTMYFLKYIRDWKSLENISAKEWIIKYQGENVYKKLWDHLIELKFRDYVDQIPMSWLWSRSIRRMAGRKHPFSKEKFGYMRGSFQVLINKLSEKIEKSGGRIIKNCEIKKIVRNKDQIKFFSKKNTFLLDKVICTIPLPIFLKSTPELPESYRQTLQKIDYKSILNIIFLLKDKLTDFFWLNISDEKIPFPGIIEFGNLKSKLLMAGINPIYVPCYLSKDDFLYSLNEGEIKNNFLLLLGRINSKIKKERVKKILIFRDEYADPVYNLNYSKVLPSFITPVDGLFLCNTSQIYPETRSVNNSIKFAKKITNIVLNGYRR